MERALDDLLGRLPPSVVQSTVQAAEKGPDARRRPRRGARPVPRSGAVRARRTYASARPRAPQRRCYPGPYRPLVLSCHGDDSVGLETAYRNAAITCGAMAASTVLYPVAVAVVSVSQAPFEGFAGQAPALDPPGRALDGGDGRGGADRARAAGLLGPVAGRGHGGAGPAARHDLRHHRRARRGAGRSSASCSSCCPGSAVTSTSSSCSRSRSRRSTFPRLDGWREWAAEPAAGMLSRRAMSGVALPAQVGPYSSHAVILAPAG